MSFIDNPVLMRRVVGCLILLSLLEWALATFTGLVNSVTYLSHLSQLTFTISVIPWWQGLRVEARQVEQDTPRDVAEHLIRTTTIEPTTEG